MSAKCQKQKLASFVRLPLRPSLLSRRSVSWVTCFASEMGLTALEGSVEPRSNPHSDNTWGNGKRFTMQFTRWQRFRALTTILGIVGIGSLALIYFIPAPPSKVVMATAFKGASFEYYGRQYQEIFARSHVEL